MLEVTATPAQIEGLFFYALFSQKENIKEFREQLLTRQAIDSALLSYNRDGEFPLAEHLPDGRYSAVEIASMKQTKLSEVQVQKITAMDPRVFEHFEGLWNDWTPQNKAALATTLCAATTIVRWA